MIDVSTKTWESLEKWSSTVFLVAGASLFIHVILVGLIGYTSVSFPEGYHAMFGLAGLVGAIIGLLGFYSRLADESRLALGSVLAVAAAGVSFSIILVWLIGMSLLTGGPPSAADWVGVLAPFAIVMIALGFFLTGIASFRAAIPSRTVGFLLLVPVLSWIVILGVGAMTNYNAPVSLDFFANGINSIAFFSIGYLLRIEPPPTDHAEPVPEPTTK